MALLGYTPEQIGKLTLKQWYIGIKLKTQLREQEQKYQAILMRTQTGAIINMFATDPVDLTELMPITDEEIELAGKSKGERIDEILNFWRNVE